MQIFWNFLPNKNKPFGLFFNYALLVDCFGTRMANYGKNADTN